MNPRIRTLSQSQIADVHAATLKVLEETGVWVDHAEARKMLADAGCRIEGSIVKMPPKLVEWAIEKSPDSIRLSNRDGDPAMDLGGDRQYFGNGPTCPHFLDPETEERRPFTLEDGRRGSILVDALPNLDYIMSFAQLSDVPPQVADRYEFEFMLSNCRKPIVFLARSKEGAEDILKMAAAVRGGSDQLAENPFVVCYPEPISPLRHPDDAVDKLLLAAEWGIPIVCTPCPMAGATAPATLAGLLVVANAETLSACVMAQLKRPGVGFINGGVITIMDMSTALITYGAPEMDLVLCGFTDLAHHYRIPIFGTAGCCDAKAVDQQAAIESTVSIYTSMLSGANLIHDVGYCESAISFSFNQMVLGDEIIGMARWFERGIEVNDTTLALDAIRRVGPGGQYLTDDHTLEHWRDEYWAPTLMDRRNLKAWTEAGAKTMGERIKDKIRHILAAHEVEPLAPEVRRQVDAVMSAVG